MQDADTVDWAGLGLELATVNRKMLCEEGFIGGDETRQAEALQRALRHRSFGLTSEAYAERKLAGAVALSEMHLEQARAEIQELRAEVRRVYREVRQDVADDLRRLAERVDAKYRREGVELAADFIDPRVPQA